MGTRCGTGQSSALADTPVPLDTTEILVGCCYGVVIVPARQLPDFYRGYAWMAGAALLFAIPFYLLLLAMEVIL